MVRLFSLLLFVMISGLLSDGRSADQAIPPADFNSSNYKSAPSQTEAGVFSGRGGRAFNGMLHSNTAFPIEPSSGSSKTTQ